METVPNKFTTLTCLQNAKVQDDLVKQIKADLEGKRSILEVMKQYTEALKINLDNNALPFRKLQRLFELGTTPDRMLGHFYGIVPGLRTGELKGLAADMGNVVGFIWGSLVSDAVPWVGKTYTLMDGKERQRIGGKSLSQGDFEVYRGINHFKVIKSAPFNVVSNTILTIMWSLKKAPEQERKLYAHSLNGGHFAAYRTPSIYKGTPREVFCLNYRFSELGNTFPLNYLIDEMVQIADGLYLGQVIFATKRLYEKYNPEADPDIYLYQHFGYFLLMDDSWNGELQRLFSYVAVPDEAVTTQAPVVPSISVPEKFRTFTLSGQVDGDVDPGILAEVKEDLKEAGTILDMFQGYSRILDKENTTESPVFSKMHTLFNSGISPSAMDGFYRGARISFQSHGFLAPVHINTLNLAWQPLRWFSPWTGKRFGPIDKKRLSELTEGYETLDKPTFFGTNTVVFRTPQEKIMLEIMKALHIWMEEATEEEKQLYGYQVNTYFFIGKEGKSILPEDKGKRVFLFNYRYKPLRNFPPDNYCIDQIVQIADGLYLGKLIYATDWLKHYDPKIDPSEYKYQLFGYFLLMDEQWHSLRLRIKYDLYNT